LNNQSSIKVAMRTSHLSLYDQSILDELQAFVLDTSSIFIAPASSLSTDCTVPQWFLSPGIFHSICAFMTSTLLAQKIIERFKMSAYEINPDRATGQRDFEQRLISRPGILAKTY
jgi:hypothetical protein